MIESGALGRPVREVTVATDFLALLGSIVDLGGDSRWIPLYGSVCTPSVAVERITVSGVVEGGALNKEDVGMALMKAAYLEGDFVLRSGKRSKYYLDKYLFETDPMVLRGIVAELAMMVREQLAAGEKYQRLAAPELGGVVLGAGLSLEVGIPLLLVRKKSKEYGTTKQIERQV